MMSAHTETSCCLIHTSQLSRDWKMWDSVQLWHSGKVYCSRSGTHRTREASGSVCLQPSLLLPHFNVPWRRQHCWSSLQCIPCPDNCCIALLINSWNQRKDRPFLACSLELSTWVHNHSCFIIHQKMVLETISGSWVMWMPIASIVRNHLPSTVNTSQWKCSEAVSQLLSRPIKRCGPVLAPNCCHLTAGLVKATSWPLLIQPASQVTCLYCW